MIRTQSYLNVADNSGARSLMCIRVLGGSQQEFGEIGDLIIAVVKDAIPNMPLKKSDVVRAVIVRTLKGVRRENGMLIRFDDNAAVIVNKDGNPRGTRVFGPIARELRDRNFTKIVSLAPEVVSGEKKLSERPPPCPNKLRIRYFCLRSKKDTLYAHPVATLHLLPAL